MSQRLSLTTSLKIPTPSSLCLSCFVFLYRLISSNVLCSAHIYLMYFPNSLQYKLHEGEDFLLVIAVPPGPGTVLGTQLGLREELLKNQSCLTTPFCDIHSLIHSFSKPLAPALCPALLSSLVGVGQISRPPRQGRSVEGGTPGLAWCDSRGGGI